MSMLPSILPVQAAVGEVLQDNGSEVQSKKPLVFREAFFILGVTNSLFDS